MSAATLSPGQRARLPQAEQIDLLLRAEGGRAAELKGALFALPAGKLGVSAPLGLISEMHVEDLEGLMRWRGERATLSLKDAPRGGERFLFAVWLVEEARRGAKHLSDFRTITLSIEAGGASALTFPLDGGVFSQETAAILGEVYFKSGGWRFKAAGDGFVGGLPSMTHRLGLNGPQRDQLNGRATQDGGGGILRGGAPPSILNPNKPRDAAPPVAGLKRRIRAPRAWPGGSAPGKVPKDILGAVARVECKTAEGIHGGSAFAITPGGCLLTCHHVIEGVTEMAVQFHGDPTPREARVITSDPACDLALIRLDDVWGAERWLKLDLAPEPPDLGDEVGLVGFPLAPVMGNEINFSRGIINSVRHPSDKADVLQIDAGAAPGSSGGPLFRLDDGVVLGVLSSGLAGIGGMHANFAVDVRALVTLGWFEG